MTRTPTTLGQHLLTRADLAKLEIPAGRILSWLAEGALEQLGELPAANGSDPVFAVLRREVRDELAAGLASLGKPTVVLTPLRVRSFLLRALLPGSPASADEAAPLPAGAAEAAAHLAEVDLAAVLQEATGELQADVATVLALAREEAAGEAAEAAAQGNDDNHEPAADEHAEPEWFDAGELAAELATWPADSPQELAGSDPVEAATAATEPTPAPAAEPAPDHSADAPQVDLAAAPAGDAEAADTPPPEAAAPAEPEPASAPEPTTAAAVEPTADCPDEPTAMTVQSDEPTLAEPGATAATPEGGSPLDFLTEPSPPTDDAAPAAPAEFAAAEPAAYQETAPAPAEAENTAEVMAAEPTANAATSPPANATATATVGTEDELLSEALRSSQQAMARVESFLTELRGTLVELAKAPPPAAPEPRVDVTPVVAALEHGFRDSLAQQTAQATALQQLGDRLGGVAEALHGGLAKLVPAAAPSQPVASAELAPTYVVPPGNRTTQALAAIGFLLLCWSGMFWWKTQDPRLVVTTLIAANAIGCCLLLGRRNR